MTHHERSPVFILGTGRCGSTLVHELVAHHPDTAWVSNLDDRLGRLTAATRVAPKAFRSLPPGSTEKGRLRLAPSEGYRLLGRRVSSMLVDPYRDLRREDAQPWLVRPLTALVDDVCARQGADVYVHKFTGWPRAEFLAEAFPGARFIHVVRDGRAVAASWLRTPWWRGHLGPAGWHFGPLDADETCLWQASGESFTVLAALAWKRLADAFEMAAKDAVGHGVPWLDVRFEDLTGGRGPEVLEAVVEHCGLRGSRSVIAAAARYGLDGRRNGDHLTAWTAHERRLVDTAIGPTLSRWGYT